jgi:NADH dehydrogenase FAD-containing subunit
MEGGYLLDSTNRLCSQNSDFVAFHLFQPLLYQGATGAWSPGEIASPLRAVLHKQRNAE